MAAEKRASVTTLKKEKIETERGVKRELLLTWKAPVRPFKKRNKEFYSTAVAIAFLFGVILFFLKEWFLIIAIIALLFFVYILSTVPPEETEHQITNKGISTSGKNYSWDELGIFWFGEQWGEKVLNIRTPFQFPGTLILLLGMQKEEEINRLLSRFLNYEEVKLSWLEKATNWLSTKIPLEKPSSQ
ncbi:MAG TPA: hypothetical protein VMW41_00700 [Candidatus Bathyarchaeia archaeon]|nr:hypothetical protein [Candidatus Bathyarchaeia archaeon]